MLSEEFKLQKRLIKWTGIIQSPMDNLRKIVPLVQGLNIFVCIYVILTASHFIVRNWGKISEVIECMPPLVTTSVTLIKFCVLLFHSNEIFAVIEEFKSLNQKCEFVN